MPPPQQFKQTPAGRVFGFGLPVNRSANRGVQYTFRGMPLGEDLQYFDPLVQQQAREEQRLGMEEQQIANQQRELERQQMAQDAEMAALGDLEAGEPIGNVFRKNPALAFSRNFNQFANMAEMVQPSKASQAMIPSLAMKLPIEERGVFNQLVSTPEFANNPFAAYDEAQRRGARLKQHGELVKNNVPLAKIDPNRDYSPIEFEDLVRQHKKPETGTDFTDKLVQQAWSGFDEQYEPPEGVVDPVAIALDIAEKKNAIREGIMQKYGGKAIAPSAATAQNITSPAAMGGATQAPQSTPASVSPSTLNWEAQLESIPYVQQQKFLEEKQAKQAEEAVKGEAWTKARKELGDKILKQVPDENLPGTKVNRLESFAKAVLNPGENMVFNREVGSQIPVAWDTLIKAGVPFKELATNKTVFREPGEARRKMGFIGTQQVGIQELLKDWATRFLESRNRTPSGAETMLLQRQPEQIVKKADEFLNAFQK